MFPVAEEVVEVFGAEVVPVVEPVLPAVVTELVPGAVVMGAVGVLAGEVVAGGVVTAEVVDPPELVLPPVVDPPPVRQEVSLLAWVVKVPDWARVPVLSRKSKPRVVPAVMLTTHLCERSVVEGKLIRAAAEGWLPGRMLKK
jgi:hypothetical protein